MIRRPKRSKPRCSFISAGNVKLQFSVLFYNRSLPHCVFRQTYFRSCFIPGFLCFASPAIIFVITLSVYFLQGFRMMPAHCTYLLCCFSLLWFSSCLDLVSSVYSCFDRILVYFIKVFVIYFSSPCLLSWNPAFGSSSLVFSRFLFSTLF